MKFSLSLSFAYVRIAQVLWINSLCDSKSAVLSALFQSEYTAVIYCNMREEEEGVSWQKACFLTCCCKHNVVLVVRLSRLVSVKHLEWFTYLSWWTKAPCFAHSSLFFISNAQLQECKCLQVRCIPAQKARFSCQCGVVALFRICTRQLQQWAGPAVFVCVCAPSGLPVALWCQPAHLPPVRPEEHRSAATQSKAPPAAEASCWTDWLLFPTLLEFNTGLFTGPSPLSLSLSPPYFSPLSLLLQHFYFLYIMHAQFHTYRFPINLPIIPPTPPHIVLKSTRSAGSFFTFITKNSYVSSHMTFILIYFFWVATKVLKKKTKPNGTYNVASGSRNPKIQEWLTRDLLFFTNIHNKIKINFKKARKPVRRYPLQWAECQEHSLKRWYPCPHNGIFLPIWGI